MPVRFEMRLPNGERAVVDLEKLREYCLSLNHPRGRHKARVFRSVLGLTRDHAGELRDALLRAAAESDATEAQADRFGRRYLIDFEFGAPARAAPIRSGWIVRAGEDFPRFTTCYLL
jgi:hypothetical protein